MYTRNVFLTFIDVAFTYVMQLLFVLLFEEMQFWLKQYGVGSDGRRWRLLVVQRVAEQRRRLTAADARRRVAA